MQPRGSCCRLLGTAPAVRERTLTSWRVQLPFVAFVVLLAPAPAWALKPGKHRAIAEDACAAARLPDSFCRRMGKQVFETDYLEWTDLSAHAQREAGQPRCVAADAALTRVDSLARKLVLDAHARRFEDAAIDLGRALHTIQDECAHHGMTNEEHAFLSLEQTCTSMNSSPDIQPAAIACAVTRTRDVMQMAAAALGDVSWGSLYLCPTTDNHNSSQNACDLASLPTPAQACGFLALHTQWDGGDSSWNGDLVGPVLVEGFRRGLAGEATSFNMCGGDPQAIDPPSPHAIQANVDLACGLTTLGCFGKVDDTTEVDPYGADLSTGAGGCMTGSSPGLVLFALALLVPRRLRRR
jgi:hypothetical protein